MPAYDLSSRRRPHAKIVPRSTIRSFSSMGNNSERYHSTALSLTLRSLSNVPSTHRASPFSERVPPFPWGRVLHAYYDTWESFDLKIAQQRAFYIQDFPRGSPLMLPLEFQCDGTPTGHVFFGRRGRHKCPSPPVFIQTRPSRATEACL